MQRITIGTSGIPASAEEYSTIGGIRRIAELGLSSMELAFVQKVYLNHEGANEVGEVAKRLNMSLSIHAPYFLNLNSVDKQIIAASKERIFQSVDRAETMGARAVCIHAGFYGKSTPEETFENIKAGLKDIVDRMKEKGIKDVKLGIETMGKKSQFGSLDEVIMLHGEVKQVIPYIDFSHVFVRNEGKIDYGEVFDRLEKLKLDTVFSHFSGMKWNESANKFVDVHVPIGDNPPFKPLAEEILKRKMEVSITCESPLLEMDALKMKSVFEKLGHDFG